MANLGPGEERLRMVAVLVSRKSSFHVHQRDQPIVFVDEIRPSRRRIHGSFLLLNQSVEREREREERERTKEERELELQRRGAEFYKGEKWSEGAEEEEKKEIHNQRQVLE